MRAPSSQVALTHVRFAAESRHIADRVGKSARPAGRKVVVLHDPLLKILVDDLGEANSRVQQLPPVITGSGAVDRTTRGRKQNGRDFRTGMKR
jgi:hypothetical protein